MALLGAMLLAPPGIDPAAAQELLAAQPPAALEQRLPPNPSAPLLLVAQTSNPGPEVADQPVAVEAGEVGPVPLLDFPRPASCSGEAPEGGGGDLTSATPGPPAAAAEVTDQSLVLEAWGVVNEAFMDARHKGWTQDRWQEKRAELLRRPPHSRLAAHAAISSMLASLEDPYSRFLSPDEMAYLTKYDITGVGLNLGELVDGAGQRKLTVLGLVLGSPAQLAGVRQGDEVLAVNGTPVEGKSPFDVSSLIQGPKGTPVTIQFRHGDCAPAEAFTVARTADTRSPVYYRVERGERSERGAAAAGAGGGPRGGALTQASRVGYIRLREFNALAKRDIVTAVERLEAAGASSFVLDLQDNPGGLVQAGVEIARLFLDPGDTVFFTEGRDPSVASRSVVAIAPARTQAPLTVLVNDNSASASEIVAAALHDNCRATLVGRRTFGKGLIQTVYELSDGSGMVLTVGKYVTPSHSDIDGNGIEPDFRRLPEPEVASQRLAACTRPGRG